jgi:hypothetical protein
MASSPISQSLDAFQTQIESKLRQPYSSLELPKFLSSKSSTGPKSFIDNLRKCFSRMTKPIQLRCLVGLLGFEPDVAKLYNDNGFDDTMREFLESLETEIKDKWVVVMAGIIRGKLFRNDFVSISNGDATTGNDNLNDHSDQQVFYSESGRNKKTDAIIKKAVDGIINSLTEASSDAVDFRNEAEVALTTTDPSEEDEKRMEKLLDSFHIGTDVKPNFVPWSYRLCSETVITEAIPELDERCDFIVNEEADILKVDERLDRKKAQEEDEDREEEQKQKLKALAEERMRKMNAAASTNTAKLQPPLVKPRGIAGNASARPMTGAGSDTAALMMRSKNKGVINGASNGVGGRLGSNTAAGGKARAAGLGRGAAANAIGGRSLANPMSRMRNPGGARALLSSRRPGAASGTTVNAGRAAMKNKIKMKMIDVSEVDVLKKEGEKRMQKQTAEEIRANKRRKIMEKGLKTKKNWGQKQESTAGNDGNNGDSVANAQVPGHDTIVPTNLNTMQGLAVNAHNNGHMNHDNHVHQTAQVDQSFIPMLSPTEMNFDSSNANDSTLQQQEFNSALNLFNMDQNELLNQQQTAPGSNMSMQQYQSITLDPQVHPQMNSNMPSHHFETHQQPQHLNHQHQRSQHSQQPAHVQNWQSLLQRSNKLTPDDRLRVEQFFTTDPRYNPTPNISVYKMKLHESRTADQRANQTIKETLYLELDYGTGAYKMSRKKKEKALQRH